MIDDETAAVARAFFEVTSSSTSPSDLLADDITWQLVTAPFADELAALVPSVRVPESHVWRGKESVLNDFIGPFLSSTFVAGTLTASVDKVIAQGEDVVVLTHVTGQLVSGGTFENDYAVVMVVRNGKIVSAVEYFDTLRWVTLVGGRGSRTAGTAGA